MTFPLECHSTKGVLMRYFSRCLVLVFFILAELHSYPAYSSTDANSPMPQLCRQSDKIAAAPAMRDIWVDPASGSDSRSGASRAEALRTFRAAWDRVPVKTPFKGAGYRILLAAGDYGMSSLPGEGWMESRHGTADFPLVIESADGPGKARICGLFNIFECRYLTLSGLKIYPAPGAEGGNTIHIEKGDHIRLWRCTISGLSGQKNCMQESLKVNQSSHIFVEECDISGGFWFSLDFVAVHYGHIKKCRIHGSGDDGVVLKGGSANLLVEGTIVYDCGNIGLAAGQGTGFEFMTPPWLHYEVYDLKMINNVVCRTRNAGAAVRGGYNVLIAHNTFYKTGLDHERGGPLLLLSPGERSCDGNSAECTKRHTQGGWGPVAPGSAGECIPDRNVYIYNNIFYNPRDCATKWSHFTVFGPVAPPGGTNIPSPVVCDKNLQIRGNVIWNGPPTHPLGVGEEGQGCQKSNPTCNEALIRQNNLINAKEPLFSDPAQNDFRLKDRGGFSATPSIPDFPGNDRPGSVPQGELKNRVMLDFRGLQRPPAPAPGAFE